jgi:type I restriction enzyme S subunit
MTAADFPLRPLGQIAENHDAKRRPVKASNRRPGPYPYYGAQGIVDHVEDYLFDGEFVLVAEDGENLRSRKEDVALLANGKFWVNNHAHILRGSSVAMTRFLLYAINQADISGYVTGSTIPKLSQGSLNRILLPCPSLGVQKSIVDLLGALDDKIELNRRMNETLEAMARAIFKDWFVDFGPTRAKMESRAPYLVPDIWALFPDRLGDEDLPEGWKPGELAKIADLNSEAWGTKRHPGAVKYVDLANTKWGTIEEVADLSWDEAPSRARRVLRRGDTIVGTVRPGNGSFAYIGNDGLTGSTGFAVLRPVETHFRELVWCAATSSSNIERLTHLADGGAYPAVRPDLVSATELCIAPDAIIAEFSECCGPLLERMEANKCENEALAATRDLLLPQLMSGEIRIRDAQAMVADAA